jgi:hypothetical protein
MAGILPNEGEEMIVKILAGESALADERGTDLDLVLITNSTISETTTAGSLTQPTGTGYAPITLSDGSWTGSGDSRSYPIQTWTAGGTWTGGVYGYAILTKGTTPRIMAMELEGGGPYSLNDGDTYSVTPTITVA